MRRLSSGINNSTLLSRSERGAGRRCGRTLDNRRRHMVTYFARFAVAAVAATFWLLSATGQSAQAQAEWINAVRQGGYVIVFRHGATHQDQADTDPLNPKNVAQQRQLNEAGRAKAKEIGEPFRKLRIPVGQVQSSVFNRAVETGTLMGLGEVTATVDLAEGGLVVTPIENNRRAQRCASSPRRCRPPAPISSSSPTSPIFSMPSARTGSTCAKARRRCSSPAAADTN